MGTQLSGPWVKASGTSFASPEVAGMVAKYLSQRGQTKPKAVMTAFESHARDVKGEPRDGAGLVDYAATVDQSTSPDERDDAWPTTTATIEDASSGDRLTLSDDWFPPGEYTVSVTPRRRRFCISNRERTPTTRRRCRPRSKDRRRRPLDETIAEEDADDAHHAREVRGCGDRDAGSVEHRTGQHTS